MLTISYSKSLPSAVVYRLAQEVTTLLMLFFQGASFFRSRKSYTAFSGGNFDNSSLSILNCRAVTNPFSPLQLPVLKKSMANGIFSWKLFNLTCIVEYNDNKVSLVPTLILLFPSEVITFISSLHNVYREVRIDAATSRLNCSHDIINLLTREASTSNIKNDPLKRTRRKICCSLADLSFQFTV